MRSEFCLFLDHLVIVLGRRVTSYSNRCQNHYFVELKADSMPDVPNLAIIQI